MLEDQYTINCIIIRLLLLLMCFFKISGMRVKRIINILVALMFPLPLRDDYAYIKFMLFSYCSIYLVLIFTQMKENNHWICVLKKYVIFNNS